MDATEYKRAYRAKRRALGLCIDCDSKAEPGRAVCEWHRHARHLAACRYQQRQFEANADAAATARRLELLKRANAAKARRLELLKRANAAKSHKARLAELEADADFVAPDSPWGDE